MCKTKKGKHFSFERYDNRKRKVHVGVGVGGE